MTDGDFSRMTQKDDEVDIECRKRQDGVAGQGCLSLMMCSALCMEQRHWMDSMSGL